MNSAKKCGSSGFGRTLQAPPGPLPRSNGIMFQDQGSKGSISHATSPEHNANAQVHLNITKRNLIYYSNRTYLGLSKHGKAYAAQPRRAHIPQSLLELAGLQNPHTCPRKVFEQKRRYKYTCRMRAALASGGGAQAKSSLAERWLELLGDNSSQFDQTARQWS